ncbi:amylo-alpha-1,6-glucosidase [Nitrosovibrio tenuis]|uniref:4-alpha-glucanotransferase n=1 Tax=Nitrosovibrio tenuis TaxID=1233 RepID=A0A1H7GUP0_9PROT|nr:amylo-alpha-1,6-glucosidase [Nitrosovibrio tenuis]SEK41798.1 4-alpha-glucanotransferase [Nitrosovibrio tenuis]
MEPPDIIRFGRATCCDLEQASRREWWLADGLGGYAGGTIAQCLTRRYHGLLIAPAETSLERRLIFVKADATLHDSERSWPLFTNCWGSGAVEPKGLIHIESFQLDGSIPVWRFAIDDLILEQCIWMEQDQHTTCIAWRLAHALERPVYLGIDLLINNRSHHRDNISHEFSPAIEGDERHISVRHAGDAALHFYADGGQLFERYQWIDDFYLAREHERGLGDRDAHLCAAHMRLPLSVNWNGLVATRAAAPQPHLSELLRRRRAHDVSRLMTAAVDAPELRGAPCWVRQLVLAADNFLIIRPAPRQESSGKEDQERPGQQLGQRGELIIAGYPWFGEWGRDTMIALPGLLLATGRHASARNILAAYARFADRGMLPNTLPDEGGQPQYNTVDAALWYFEAWRAYISVSHDVVTLREFYPLLQEMVDWHVRGTRHSIGADPDDGLLRVGEPGLQLTWMDAKVGDCVVTPRHGKPVEINALWFNALTCMMQFSQLIGKKSDVYKTLAGQARKGFQRFLKPEGGLYDVLDGPEGNDASIRPNQILAVTLHYSPLSPSAQALVLAEARRHLLTSYGLRSLAAEHPGYRPHYEGGVRERDTAYHQGTAWSWLLPHYAMAEYRVTGNADLAQSRLAPMRDHLLDAGLGTISEIFDGEPPHEPRGAPSQAWSVAGILEAWVKLERVRRAAKQKEED